MNATVTLGGVVLNPASIAHNPVRVSTVNRYQSGRAQEYYRNTKRSDVLDFVATEAEMTAIETLSRSTTTLTYIDELARSITVHIVSFSAVVSAEISMTKPLWRVTLTIEEV